MRSLVFLIAAAVCEIAGCFSFWAFFRLGRSPLWLTPGIASLLCFAFFLTRVDAEFAGRAYAAYGGVYVAASLTWLALVEKVQPDRWDVIGTLLCLTGTAVILWAPR
ncbi:MAG: YnfA family protein [Acidobacteriota bacterium]